MRLSIVLILLFTISCTSSHSLKKDRKLFNSSAVQNSFRSVADMNDSYFIIKENNFFEFYRQLFDSVKNTSYPGWYTMKGDTMILHYYNRKGARLLGDKALVNSRKHEISFFKQEADSGLPVQ